MRAALGAILSRDGRAIERREIESLAAQARLPGSWRPRTGVSGALGLLEMRQDDPASDTPPQPHGELRWVDGCWVILDGVLDNSGDLVRELGGGAGLAPDASDQEILVAAYRRWGSAMPAKLLGEFAFLLWDDRHRRLLCARDPFGVRNLFIAQRNGTLYVASQLRQVRDGSLSLNDLNEEYVADFLTSHIAVGGETPFKSIRRLPAGHVLIAEQGNVRTERYWDFEPGKRLQYRTAEEYVEHFRSLFREAVAKCLRSGQRVWSELSGGLDSSSIVCMAQEIFAQEPALDRGFATVTRVWDHTPQSDERQWAQAVVEKYGLSWHAMRCDGLAFDGAEQEALYRDEPHFGLLLYPIVKREADLLRDHGVDVLLSGARAEIVLLGELPAPVHLSDLLRTFQLRKLARELSAWQRAMQVPLSNLFLGSCVRPLFDKRGLNRTLEDNFRAPKWLDERFARRLDLEERARTGRMPVRFRSAADQYQYEMIGRTEQMITRGYLSWCHEIRHPFLYRPLVEFGLATPWEYKIRPGIHKWLLRVAMKGLLPEPVRLRAGKKGPGPAIYKCFPDHWETLQGLVRSSLLADVGVIDPRRFQEAAELARHGTAERFALLLGALAFEIWLRAILAPSGPAGSTA